MESNSGIHVSEAEQRDAIRWFIIAGLFAVALCIFLKTSDDRLTNSKREELLGQTLRDLRGAQYSLPSQVSDPRTSGLPSQ